MNLQAKHAYEVCNFYVKTTRYLCLLSDKYKYTVNASNKDHKITILLHNNIILMFKCYIQHSNVATFEGFSNEQLFMHYIYRSKYMNHLMFRACFRNFMD